MQVEYKVGDVILANIGYLKESEIEEIAVKAQCMKIDGTWYEASYVTPKIKAVLGNAIYTKGFFGATKRTVKYV